MSYTCTTQPWLTPYSASSTPSAAWRCTVPFTPHSVCPWRGSWVSECKSVKPNGHALIIISPLPSLSRRLFSNAVSNQTPAPPSRLPRAPGGALCRSKPPKSVRDERRQFKGRTCVELGKELKRLVCVCELAQKEVWGAFDRILHRHATSGDTAVRPIGMKAFRFEGAVRHGHKLLNKKLNTLNRPKRRTRQTRWKCQHRGRGQFSSPTTTRSGPSSSSPPSYRSSCSSSATPGS